MADESFRARAVRAAAQVTEVVTFYQQHHGRIAAAAELGGSVGRRVAQAGGVLPFLRREGPGFVMDLLDGKVAVLRDGPPPPSPRRPASAARPAAARPPIYARVVAEAEGEAVPPTRPKGR